MTGSRARIAAFVLAAASVLALLGWAALEVLHDPLADLDELLPAGQKAPDRDVDFHSPGPEYVGSADCAACHAETSERYQSHAKSHSFSVVSATANDASALPGRFSAPGPEGPPIRFEYRATRDDGGMTHHETALDAEGNELGSRAVEVHYAVGSGKRGHSYLRDVGGAFLLSPISWYAGERGWDLSPGYDQTNEHFEHRVRDDCVFCHVGRAAAKPDRANTFAREPILEMEIGCERCHGPGRAHVSYHQSADAGRAESETIVNPARLSQPLRDDVCFQCHLLGLDRLPHPGGRPFDFRPGGALADIWMVVMKDASGPVDVTTGTVGHPEQMLASRCYIESRGAMSCTSCHDPHGSVTATERGDFYRSKCLACHASADGDDCAMQRSARLLESSADSCIQCHMPLLDVREAYHAAQTDHRIVRRTAETAAPGPQQQPVIYELDRMPLELVNRSRGVLLVRREPRHSPLIEKAIPLLRPWVSTNSYDVEALTALGTACHSKQDTRNALTMLDLALSLDPDFEEALRQRVLVSHDLGDVEGAIRYGRRLIGLNPHRFDDHARRAHMLGRVGRWSAAIDAARTAAEMRPWNPQIHGWLAEAYRITGQKQLSNRHAELYEKLLAASRPDER